VLRKHIERWRNRRQLAVAVLTSDFHGSAAATATSGQSNSTWGRIAARTDRLVVLASWFQFAFPCRLISWFLWHTRICAETASRSVQPFLPNTQSDTHTDAHTHTHTHTHAHTHNGTCDVCINRHRFRQSISVPSLIFSRWFFRRSPEPQGRVSSYARVFVTW